MVVQERLLFIFLIFLVESGLVLNTNRAAGAIAYAAVRDDHESLMYFNRTSFPKDFIFGTASSAYQIEGAANEGGRGQSIWDTFTNGYPGKIKDRSNGNVATDAYHRYKEDVGIMKEQGFDAYRFSISWSRILPNGKLSGGVNKEGVMYYNNLINELLSKGIQPYATIYHFDLPQTLEDDYMGFLSPHIVDDFRDYADVCFKEFGDRVKHWITLNEPYTVCNLGYTLGVHAPGRCSPWSGNCSAGDSGKEPYLVAHYQLLAHATVVKLYKDKYQASQKGKIGITLATEWFEPYSHKIADIDAAERALDFIFGWFMHPLTYGEYPHTMQSLVGNRLPNFSEEQAKMVKGSFDFVGLNYYTANYAANIPSSSSVQNKSYATDSRVNLTGERNGILIGPKGATDWLYVYPKGIEHILLYTKKKYKNPIIYITENGFADFNNSTLSLEEALADSGRIDYYNRHLYFTHRAIKKGVNVRGFFAWSVLDNFEWNDGYTVRFGINFVDYKNGLKRYPKHSASWFQKFLGK